jgi:hypothetical protein
MIILPTKRKLERRRDILYERLDTLIHIPNSVRQTEDIMRRIHMINLRLRTYFTKGHEPKELFDEEDPT